MLLGHYLTINSNRNFFSPYIRTKPDCNVRDEPGAPEQTDGLAD